jgi:hypothetical protein
MKYAIVLLLLAALIHLLSFAKYNWKKNNRLAAVGSAIIGFAAFVIPLYLIFLRDFEI